MSEDSVRSELKLPLLSSCHFARRNSQANIIQRSVQSFFLPKEGHTVNHRRHRFEYLRFSGSTSARCNRACVESS